MSTDIPVHDPTNMTPEEKKRINAKIKLLDEQRRRMDTYLEIMHQKIDIVRALTKKPQEIQDVRRHNDWITKLTDKERNDLMYRYNIIAEVPTW